VGKVLRTKIIVGVDEAGRGPIAGPVSVGAFMFLDFSARRFFGDARDSKKLSEKKREEIFERIVKYSRTGHIRYAVFMSSASHIDRRGIVSGIKKALVRCLDSLEIEPEKVQILLDGSLRAPEKFSDQKTIIKGDDKIKEISLASICAKVMRDRHMIKIARKYPEYGLEIHKGYGTRGHYEAIKKNGPSKIHRKSFLLQKT
jgi:ribonuclease HII